MSGKRWEVRQQGSTGVPPFYARLVIREIGNGAPGLCQNNSVRQGRVFTWKCLVGGKEKHAVGRDDSLGVPSVIQLP